MGIYRDSAKDLLKIYQNENGNDEFCFLSEQDYIFKYRRNYEGLMSKVNPKFKNSSKCKQGLFDIRGNMNNDKLTHQALYRLLFENTSFKDCLEVWQGNMPQATGKRKHALLSLGMLMFEQEVNFGNEVFQRKSHFSPRLDKPNHLRPRDLLMGYINYMFGEGNTECLKEFQNYKGLLLPPQFKNIYVKEDYFDVLKDDNHAIALMAREEVVNAFRREAEKASDNPNI